MAKDLVKWARKKAEKGKAPLFRFRSTERTLYIAVVV